MHRYTNEEKEHHLQRADEVGVAKASEEGNVSIQSLYKWRNTRKLTQQSGDASHSHASTDLDLIKDEEELKKRIRQLESENAVLYKKCVRYQKALTALIEE